MDRDETTRPAPSRTAFADRAEVSDGDRPLLETPGGRSAERDPADRSDFDDEARRIDVGAVPRSTVTGRHEPGTGGQETEDGLSETEEAIRRAAEDIATAPGEEDRGDEIPVFERGGLPKV